MTTPLAEIPRPRALILYATQSGTSEDLALTLADTLTRLRLSATTHSFASFVPHFLTLASYDIVFLLVSTTGQGDFPDSAVPLWRKLCLRKIPANWLQSVRFGVFALGDSAYPLFCWAGKKIERRLLQLGATALLGRVEADASSDEGTEGAFERWRGELRRLVLERWPLPEGTREVPEDRLLPPGWTLQFKTDVPTEERQLLQGVAGQEEHGWMVMRELHAPRKGSFLATVEENTRVTAADHFQDVRKLRLRLPEERTWRPGDTVALCPKNFPDDVSRFLELQHWEHLADLPLTLLPACDDPPPSPLPETIEPLTLRTLLTHHLSIKSIPTRRFFSLAQHFAEDEQHKERLAEFADPQWVEELWDYTTRPRRNILEVLQEFSSIRIPLQYLLSLVPRLRPREFSIASSSKKNAKELELLIAIVKYKTIIKAPRWGICSRWIAGLEKGQEVSVVINTGSLGDVPEEQPVLMIAPGTGVAPMRALVQDRGSVGRDVLYFGCREKEKDYYFREEWKEESEKRGLTIRTAFSREQKRKVYVQALVRAHKDEVWKTVMEDGGVVFVCGSSGRMPLAVREALVDVYKAMKQSDEIPDEELTRQGQQWLKQLESEKRYKQETW